MTPRFLPDELAPDALRVLRRAVRIETPCDGGTVAWHVWGEGRPLVLLHGGSGSWTHWIRNVEAIAAAGRRVIVPDLPGFGDSAPPGDGQDADAMVAPIAAGLVEVAGADTLDIVGFSFGGMLAVLLARAHPRLAGRLLIAGAPGLGLRSTRLPLKAWRHVTDEARLRAIHRHNLAMLMLHDPQAIDELAVTLQLQNAARDRMRRRKLALTDIVAQALPELHCPLDAIYGQEDALYRDFLDDAEKVLRTAPEFGEMVVVPGAGHWVQYEAADAFNAAVLRLLP